MGALRVPEKSGWEANGSERASQKKIEIKHRRAIDFLGCQMGASRKPETLNGDLRGRGGGTEVGSQEVHWSFHSVCVDEHAAWARMPCTVKQMAAMGACPDARTLFRVAFEAPDCDCGQEMPERKHWMWECSSTGGNATTAKPEPEDLIRARLAVPLLPLPPSSTRFSASRRSKGLERVMGQCRSRAPICATDGSYDAGASGWGACFVDCAASTVKRWNARVHGADQSSLAAESEAVERVLMANIHVKKEQIVFIIDNSTVVHGVNCLVKNVCYVPKYSFGRWERIADMIDKQRVECYKVPSHGKKPDWTPPVAHHGSAAQWREWNDIADEEAAAGRVKCSRFLGLALHSERVDKARCWARAALQRMFNGAEQYVRRHPETEEKWSHAFQLRED